MRLRDIQRILHENLESIRVSDGLEGVALPTGRPGSRIPLNAGRLREALEQLRTIPPFREDVDRILGVPVVRHAPHSDMVEGEQGQVNQAHSILLPTYRAAKHLSELLDQLLPVESSLTISVKLPHIESLRGLGDTISDLEFIFDQPARRVVGEGVSFHGLDSGSSWVEILAASKLVLVFTAGLIAVAHRYARKSVAQEQADQLYAELGAISEELRLTAQAGLRKLARDWSEDLVSQQGAGSGSASDRAEATNLTVAAVEKLAGLFLRCIRFTAPCSDCELTRTSSAA